MRRIALFLLIALPGVAANREYSSVAHVIGVERHDTSTFGPAGFQDGEDVQVSVRIDSRVYFLWRTCRLEVGRDYPARVEKGRVVFDRDGKSCKARIHGEREAYRRPMNVMIP